MTDGMTPAQDAQAALFMDFENLILGLRDDRGQDWEESCDLEVIMNLAEEFGTVSFANAYADWRSAAFNQFQTDLDRMGVDLVQIFTRRGGEVRKNAADVRMAVDAIETVWTLPHIQTFVIVSGDRDFMHVLKALRRHGKQVIGVAPDRSASSDFAKLCDRFIKYSALVPYPQRSKSTGETNRKASWRQIKEAVARCLTENAESGLRGRELQHLLRREFPTFDLREYRCNSLTELLRKMPDIAHIEGGRHGGDMVVTPAKAPQAGEPGAKLKTMSSQIDLIRRAHLADYRYEPDAHRRRQILEAIHESMTRRGKFTWEEVTDDILGKNLDFTVSSTALSKYQAILLQARALRVEDDGNAAPLKQRKMTSAPDVRDLNDLIFRYESSIAYKLADQVLDAAQPDKLAVLLGIDGDANIDRQLEYCRHLLAQAAAAKKA